MRKLVRVNLALGLLLGIGISMGLTIVDRSEVKAEITIMADCCQEPSASCVDRFGWKYADSRTGPVCGPVED